MTILVILWNAGANAKGGEIRDTKNLNLSRNIVSLLVFGQCLPFFTSRDQLDAQQKHLLQVKENLVVAKSKSWVYFEQQNLDFFLGFHETHNFSRNKSVHTRI